MYWQLISHTGIVFHGAQHYKTIAMLLLIKCTELVLLKNNILSQLWLMRYARMKIHHSHIPLGLAYGYRMWLPLTLLKSQSI